MIKWLIKLFVEITKAISNKRKNKLCDGSCLMCKYWRECMYEWDIDDCASNYYKAYNDGYKDGSL